LKIIQNLKKRAENFGLSNRDSTIFQTLTVPLPLLLLLKLNTPGEADLRFKKTKP
jgi:hypothetical protein